jgi:AcrR family transcriptional regulator
MRRTQGHRTAYSSGSFRQLKPHPGSAGTAVRDHQLGRIHAATIDLVAQGGYKSLSAAAIARAAGVSKHTFYEHFADKEECFLATYDLIVREMTRGILAAQSSDGREWQKKLRVGFVTLAEELAEQPAAAQFALVEIFNGRPQAAQRVAHAAGLLEALISHTFDRAGDGVTLPTALRRVIVGGCSAVARARLLTGRAEELRDEVDGLIEWAQSLRHIDAGRACQEGSTRAVASMRRPPGPGPRAKAGRREREMILCSCANLCATDGYAKLSVERVRAVVGISPRRFSAYFDGIEACFLASIDYVSRGCIAEVRWAYESEEDWPRAICAALDALCGWLDDDQELVRLLLVEVFVAGPVAMDWRTERIASLAALAYSSLPPARRPSAVAGEASVAGAWALLASRAREDPGSSLLPLVPSLCFVLLAPVVGPRSAAAAIEALHLEPADAEDQKRSGHDRRLRATPGREGEKEPVPGC